MIDPALSRFVIELAAQKNRQGLVCQLLLSVNKLTSCIGSHFFDIHHEMLLDDHGRLNSRYFLVNPVDPKRTEHPLSAFDGVDDCFVKNRTVIAQLAPYQGQRRLVHPIPCGERVQSVLLVDLPQKDAAKEHLIFLFSNLYIHLEGLLKERDQDPLTGLLNRRSFDETIATVLNHLTLRRRGGRLPAAGACLAVLDIDHFKKVNDRFGHAIGDEVLILFARLMQAIFRHDDKLFRFGGEEFLVILVEVDAEKAHRALERFRHSLETYLFPQVERVTVSIGYVMINGRDYPPVMLEKADKALYFVKEHGRNQVCSYEQLVADQAMGEVNHPTGEVELWDL